MEPYSAPNTTPTYAHSSEDAASTTNDATRTPPNDVQQHTPTQAVIDFDGNVTRVRAHTLKSAWIGRATVTYVCHVLALLICIVLGITMALVSGFNTVAFGYWMNLFSLGVGGFLPQPKIKDKDEKRITNVERLQR